MSSDIEVLRDYIRKETGYERELGPDDDLQNTQILDSYNIVSLAVFIQEHFGVELEPEDLVIDNLGKLSSIVALIQRKRAYA
jgi:acyl carrier protein